HISLVTCLVAVLGTLPYLHDFYPEVLTATSPIACIAFLGPILALAVITRAHELIPTAGAIFAAMLIGLGLLNVLWGGLASWLTEKGTSAWHYSFMAAWGLALCAFGVLLVDGQAAAVLLLYAIVLSRL